MRFGNCEPPPTFKLLVCTVGVNGRPVKNVAILFSCQPPAIQSTGLGAAVRKRLPRPNGISQVQPADTLCRRSKVELARCAARLFGFWMGLPLDSPLDSSMLCAHVQEPENRTAPNRRSNVVCRD